MKISQLTKSTKVTIAIAAATAALTAEAVAAATQTENVRTIPLAALGIFVTAKLCSEVVRNIKADARIRKEVLQKKMKNSQEKKGANKPI